MSTTEPCTHENLEHFPEGDLDDHPRAFTICLDCGISPEELAELLEPLYPEDVTE